MWRVLQQIGILHSTAVRKGQKVLFAALFLGADCLIGHIHKETDALVGEPGEQQHYKVEVRLLEFWRKWLQT